MSHSGRLPGPPLRARVYRGGIVESSHIGWWVMTDAHGRVLAGAGEPDARTTLRSAAKPLQAIPLVTLPNAPALDLRDEELAIVCASHPGSPRHTALAASVLALSGFLPDDLVCGPAGGPPGAPSPLRHGCSGNHAGILAIAHLLGAPLAGYERPDHPAQRLIAGTVAMLAGAQDVPTATDGCGIPTFAPTLREMARAWARLVRPGEPWERIPHVMAAHPELIGAEDWIDVRLMQATAGRLVAKTGAEGLLCVGLREDGGGDGGCGLAIKVLDGAARALAPIALAALERVGWLTPAQLDNTLLAVRRAPRILDSTGAVVGEVRVP